MLINPIVNPLIQIFITFSLCSGILYCGKLINFNFFKKYNFLFFDLSIGTIFLSQLIFISYLVGFFKESVTFLSYILIFLGILNLKNLKNKKLFKYLFNIKKYSFDKLIIISTLLLFIIISLGPPSMPDALDYHYGIPLYLLKYSYLPSHYIWLHGALFGNGDLFNAVGLYLGSDNFFTFFQVFALILFFYFIKIKERDNSKLFFIILFIISSPVILFLISGPKPLLFPQLLTAGAIYIYFKEKNFNSKNFILISILLMGAAQFKLSFLLSGITLGSLVFIKILKNDKKVIFYLFLFMIFFFLPKALYNFNQVSEYRLINIFTLIPAEFIEYLKSFRDNNFFYPINLFVPSSFGNITTILGFQLIFLFFIKKFSLEFSAIVKIVFVTIILHFIFGQQTSRLYFEFLLWIGIGFLFINKKNFKFKFFSFFIYPQLLIVSLCSLYFAITILPSYINLDYRDKFMRKNTYEYESIKWVNSQLPSDIVVISEFRSISLFESEHIPFHYYQKNNQYVDYLKIKKPIFYITTRNDLSNNFLKDCIGKKYKISKNLTRASRVPLNRNLTFKVNIYHFDYNKLDHCKNIN